MTMTTEELLRQLKSKEIVIFGAGFVAEMFYRALELHGAEGSLCFCAVTRAGSGQRFHGRPVLSLSEADIREDMLVCLAVHESAEDSLRETLRPYEAQTVRIYPHLFELLYGAPVRYEAALPPATSPRCSRGRIGRNTGSLCAMPPSGIIWREDGTIRARGSCTSARWSCTAGKRPRCAEFRRWRRWPRPSRKRAFGATARCGSTKPDG